MTDFERITEMLKKADIGFSIVPIRGCEGFKSIEANNGSFGEKISAKLRISHAFRAVIRQRQL